MINAYQLRINNSVFSLPPTVSPEALKVQVQNAVAAGGGFVDLVSASMRRVSLLITAATDVRIEEVIEPIASRELTDDGYGIPFFDYEQFDLSDL
jgi:hypothetical protein